MIRREKVREREKGGWGGRGEVARDYKHTHASKCSNTHTHTHTHTQVGRDLGPDSRGYLKITDFMWNMSRPLIVEVLVRLCVCVTA